MTTATEAFRWTAKYAVNIAALDNQHRNLFGMINQLSEALGNGEGATILDPILQRLLEYASTHFAAEEGLMTKYNFPGAGKHEAEHAAFKNQVGQFLEDHESGKAGVPVALLFFLQSWLKEHILVTDKAYSTFLNARGVH